MIFSQARIYRETGAILTGIGVYSFNTSDDEAARMRDTVQETVLAHDWALQMHGFYVDMETKNMRFDVVVSFKKNAKEAIEELMKEMKELFPDYSIHIVPDVDFSD